MSALFRRRAAQSGLSIHHHVPSRYQSSGAINLDDQAAKADVDAHGAMQPVGEDGGRIGDMPPMRFYGVPGLTPQGREQPRSIRPGGQNLIREVLMQVYGDLWQDCLLQLKANEIAQRKSRRVSIREQCEEVRS